MLSKSNSTAVLPCEKSLDSKHTVSTWLERAKSLSFHIFILPVLGNISTRLSFPPVRRDDKRVLFCLLFHFVLFNLTLMYSCLFIVVDTYQQEIAFILFQCINISFVFDLSDCSLGILIPL